LEKYGPEFYSDIAQQPAEADTDARNEEIKMEQVQEDASSYPDDRAYINDDGHAHEDGPHQNGHVSQLIDELDQIVREITALMASKW
jgi:hypothetical protein